MMGLIGSTWKSSNAWSGRVLTAENLTHTRPAKAGWKHDIHARYAILRQHTCAQIRTDLRDLCGFKGLFGGESGSDTPGPIPNPVVTASSADGTAPEGVWESRTPPNI